MPVDQAAAIQMCRMLETIAPNFGAHVALTGGCLYKDGARKDADILFYRIRQREHIDTVGLLAALRVIGLSIESDHGWCVKAGWNGYGLDLFFPERNPAETAGLAAAAGY